MKRRRNDIKHQSPIEAKYTPAHTLHRRILMCRTTVYMHRRYRLISTNFSERVRVSVFGVFWLRVLVIEATLFLWEEKWIKWNSIGKILYMSLLSLCPKNERDEEEQMKCSSHTLLLSTTIKLIRIKFKGNMLCHATNANDLSLSRSLLVYFQTWICLVRVLLVLFLLLMVVCQYIGGCYSTMFTFCLKNKKKQKLFPFVCVWVWVFVFVGLSHTTL